MGKRKEPAHESRNAFSLAFEYSKPSLEILRRIILFHPNFFRMIAFPS